MMPTTMQNKFTYILVYCLVLVGLANSANAAPPALDGSVTGVFSTTTTGTVSLTTTQTNDLISVFVATETKTAQGAPSTVVSVTSPGLTFTKRSSSSGQEGNGNHSYMNLEQWTAPSAAALTAATITVTVTASPAVDDAAIIAFGVSGSISTSTPWDTNPGLPANAFNSTQTPTVNINTTESNDFVFSGGAQDGNFTMNVGSPFTLLAHVINNGGSFFCALTIAYNQVTSSQAGLLVASQSSVSASGLYSNNANGTPILADAITADASPITIHCCSIRIIN